MPVSFPFSALRLLLSSFLHFGHSVDPLALFPVKQFLQNALASPIFFCHTDKPVNAISNSI